MQKNFTLTKIKNVSNKNNVTPKESTINFIKQFARVCTMSKLSQQELGVFIMN